MRGAPGVFGGDDGDLAEYPQRPQRDVFEVADRRGDHEQRAGHWRETGYCTIGGSRRPGGRPPRRPPGVERKSPCAGGRNPHAENDEPRPAAPPPPPPPPSPI